MSQSPAPQAQWWKKELEDHGIRPTSDLLTSWPLLNYIRNGLVPKAEPQRSKIIKRMQAHWLDRPVIDRNLRTGLVLEISLDPDADLSKLIEEGEATKAYRAQVSYTDWKRETKWVSLTDLEVTRADTSRFQPDTAPKGL